VDDSVAPSTDLTRIILPVADVKATARFYSGALGLTPIRDPKHPDISWFRSANNLLIGFAFSSGSSTGGTTLQLRVDHLADVLVRLEDWGATRQPGENGNSRVEVRDPDGNRIQIESGRGISPHMSSRTRVDGEQLLIEEETRLNGAPEAVWATLTDASLLSAWLCGGPVDLEPREGGRLRLTFPHIGRRHTIWNCTITYILPPARLRFREEDFGIEITFDLAPSGDDGETLIRLTQTPMEVEGMEDPERVAGTLGLSWRRILRRLALLMEDELDGVDEEDLKFEELEVPPPDAYAPEAEEEPEPDDEPAGPEPVAKGDPFIRDYTLPPLGTHRES